MSFIKNFLEEFSKRDNRIFKQIILLNRLYSLMVYAEVVGYYKGRKILFTIADKVGKGLDEEGCLTNEEIGAIYNIIMKEELAE